MGGKTTDGFMHLEHEFNVRIIEYVSYVVGRVATADRAGGYFCIADQESGDPILLLAVGKIADDKAEKYRLLAQEKAKRLATHKNHVSSWQSRSADPEQRQFGGAVWAGIYIFSFSGFPEELDEAVMLDVAIRDGRVTTDEATAIARISGNKRYSPEQHCAI